MFFFPHLPSSSYFSPIFCPQYNFSCRFLTLHPAVFFHRSSFHIIFTLPPINVEVKNAPPPRRLPFKYNHFRTEQWRLDTQNDGLEQVAPLKKWQIFGIYVKFLRCITMKYGRKSIPYTILNQHSNGISPSSVGNTSSKGPLSIAMWVYRSVYILSFGAV